MKKFLGSDLATIFSLSIGILLRFFPVLNSDFPLNDGGMFYSMTNQLLANGFHLPELMTYNNLQLPFAYPPLGFYLMGFLNRFFGWDLLTLFRFVPATLACLTLPAFYFLAKEIFNDRAKANLALFIYATLFSSYYILIVGGGLTRSLGMIFAILTLYFYSKWSRVQNRLYLTLSGISFGLTALSHLEMTVFAVLGLFLITIFSKVNIKNLLILIFLGVVVSSCWWLTIFFRFGFNPFIAAFSTNLDTRNGWQDLAFLRFTRESGLTLWAVIGLLGSLFLLWQKKYFLPLWLFLLFIILRRGAETTASLVWALICAEVLIVIFNLSFEKRRSVLAIFVVCIWTLFYLVNSIQPAQLLPKAILESVSLPDRVAMSWVKSNTLPTDKFLIISGTSDGAWSADSTLEWFPTLSDRESLLTIQGTEWQVGKSLEVFRQRSAIFHCLNLDPKCIDYLATTDLGFSYSYLYLTSHESCPDSSCLDMRIYAYYSPLNFIKVFEQEGVSVWKKTL